jgi:MraZ protein
VSNPKPVTFTGTTFQTLDDKGRVVLPFKFRCELGATFTLTRGPGPCLLVMHNNQWAVVAEKIAEMPTFGKKSLMAQRLVLGAAVEAKQDQQGRTQIPQALREMAGFGDDKDLVVVGCGRHIEIWSRSRWDTYNSGFSEDDIGDILEWAMSPHPAAAPESPETSPAD